MLAKAAAAVASTVEQVKVETDIVHGDPATQLVNASRTARMVCVGYKGGRHSAHRRRHRGAIASEVAKSALCTAVVPFGAELRRRIAMSGSSPYSTKSHSHMSCCRPRSTRPCCARRPFSR